MADLGVLTYIDNLNINSVTIASLDPAILKIVGEDFKFARKVLINNKQVDRFEIVDNQTILVEIPLESKSLNNISVISSGPTKTADTSSILVTFPDNLSLTTGIAGLAQRVIKILLTTVGTNKFFINEGGNINSYLASTNADKNNSTNEIVSTINQVAEYIFEDPAYKKLSSEEQLSSLELISTFWDRENQTLNVNIKIVNNAGQSTISTVGV